MNRGNAGSMDDSGAEKGARFDPRTSERSREVAVQRNRLNLMEPEQLRLPRPATPALNPANFLLCGIACVDPRLAQFQMELYQWAYAQAQAVATPSVVERDLAGVWN
jgi:hypothetical protein